LNSSPGQGQEAETES
jgi:hypothetical protein